MAPPDKPNPLAKQTPAIAYLRTLLGSFSTPEEYAKAARYLASIQTEKEFKDRTSAWNRVLASEGGNEWGSINVDGKENTIRLETHLYRIMLQTSSFFLHGQRLERNINALLFELTSAAELWACLAMNNREFFVKLLDRDGKELKNNGGTPAEVFRAFMDAHKKKEVFEQWTLARMITLRHRIYTDVKLEEVIRGSQRSKRFRVAAGKLFSSTYCYNIDNELQLMKSTDLDIPSAKRQKVAESPTSDGKIRQSKLAEDHRQAPEPIQQNELAEEPVLKAEPIVASAPPP